MSNCRFRLDLLRAGRAIVYLWAEDVVESWELEVWRGPDDVSGRSTRMRGTKFGYPVPQLHSILYLHGIYLLTIVWFSSDLYVICW